MAKNRGLPLINLFQKCHLHSQLLNENKDMYIPSRTSGLSCTPGLNVAVGTRIMYTYSILAQSHNLWLRTWVEYFTVTDVILDGEVIRLASLESRIKKEGKLRDEESIHQSRNRKGQDNI